ncbi:MAG: Holliday junction resolvase RecU [Mycoplasmatales bacterium]
MLTNITSNTHANRGMVLEELLNKTNSYYSTNDIAYIYKKHTPINIVKVDKEKIKEAYFSQKSTTDYNGIYKGFYIDFDAKSTSSDSFNVKSNLHEHQYQHLINIDKIGGIGFLIVFFKKYSRFFLISITQIKNINTKQIKLQYFLDHCIEIQEQLNPSLNYLKAVDLLIERIHNV